MPRTASKGSRSDFPANQGFEATLWLAAHKVRNKMDAAGQKTNGRDGLWSHHICS